MSTAALQQLGPTQQRLLQLLLRQPEGMAITELAKELGITATAVRQHVTALEREDFIRRGHMRPTGRRPQRLFELTRTGREIFPRHYALLAEQLIEAIGRKLGMEGLRKFMRELGAASGRELAMETGIAGRPVQLGRMMNTAGYETRVAGTPAEPQIIAHNCVFHRLAIRTPEICEYDLELIRHASGMDVRHAECMVRGGTRCRFALTRIPDGAT